MRNFKDHMKSVISDLAKKGKYKPKVGTRGQKLTNLRSKVMNDMVKVGR